MIRTEIRVAQVNTLLGLKRCPLHEDPRKTVYELFRRFLIERDARALAMQNPSVIAAREIFNRLFRCPVCGRLCVDGRFGPAVKWGIPGRSGKFQRTPGGDDPEFVHREDGGLRLLENSDFALRLERLFTEVDEAAEVFDSHLFCAWREGEENEAGEEPADHGLYTDVIRKAGMGKATIDHVLKYHPGKRIIIIQFSYDPRNGFGFMGLETAFALAEAEKTGYRADVLGRLAQDGKIISTKLLADEKLFSETFKKHGPVHFDLVNNYPDSILGFWQAMDAMKDILIPEITKKLSAIYPNLRENGNEMHTRAMLVLANAFSGYLNTQEGFKYDEHTEEIVVATEREHGPFAMMSFSVHSLDLVHLAEYVVFAAGIVRKNRKTKRIKGDPKDPVPVVIQEIVRARPSELSEEAWEAAGKLDYEKLVASFPTWWRGDQQTEAAFNARVAEIYPSLPGSILVAINELRKKMASLFDPRSKSAKHLTKGSLVVLPTIADGDRRTRLVIPFILKGY